jgi:hypothetical protein
MFSEFFTALGGRVDGYIIHIAISILAAVFGVLWYLLKQKDSAQERQIDMLFRKQDENESGLNELRIHIAGNHYVKTELDAKLDRIEAAVQRCMQDFSIKLDRLTNAFMERK